MANLEMSFIPLRCMMLKTMVAFIKKRIKKSTISAINLWAKDGMTYSLPACPFIDYMLIALDTYIISVNPYNNPAR